MAFTGGNRQFRVRSLIGSGLGCLFPRSGRDFISNKPHENCAGQQDNDEHKNQGARKSERSWLRWGSHSVKDRQQLVLNHVQFVLHLGQPADHAVGQQRLNVPALDHNKTQCQKEQPA